YQVVVTQSGYSCDNLTSTCATVTVTPPATAFAGANATICSGSTYGLMDATSGNAQSAYWSTSGTGSFNNANTLHPVYNPGVADITAGHVTLTLHAVGTAPCQEVTSAMVLTIQKVPVADAGNDGAICETSTFCLCDAVALYYQSFYWSTLGTGTFTSIYDIRPTYMPGPADIAAGRVKLVLHVTGIPPCGTVTDTLILCINRIPLAFAGQDAMICQGFNYQIQDATASFQTVLTWSSSGTGNFSDVHAVHPVYTPSQADILAGSVTLNLHLTANAPCPNSDDAMVLTIHLNPTTTAYVVSHVSCNGLSDGIVSATTSGGTSPYTYLWSTSATTQTVSGLSIGTYSVTATDHFGCVNTSSTTVTQPPLLTVPGETTRHVRCKYGYEGVIMITPEGGTPDYSYLWSNNTSAQSATGLTAGTYTVTVTDAHFCTTTGSWTVTEPDLLTVAGTVTHEVLCKGSNEGSITITAGGGTTQYSYLWSNNETSATLSGLTAGTYTVTVTDAHTCAVTGSWTVTEPPALTVTGFVTHQVLCKGGNDGSVAITVSGGTTAYQYAWSNNSTSQNIPGLTAGTYSVTVTDDHSCVVTGAWAVTEPEALSIAGVITHVDCYTYSTGEINVTFDGGVKPYNYLWSNAQTSASVSGLSAGTYHVTVTDAHSCSLSHEWTVTQPDAWSVGITGQDVICCIPGGTPGHYCATVGGSYSTPVTYQWVVTGGTISGGSNTSCIDVTWSCCGQGTVTVVATKSGGCHLSTTKTVTIDTAPAPLITGPSLVTAGEEGTVYCTPDIPDHLFSWVVIGGNVTAGQGTHCITVTWGTSCAQCNGSVSVYETYNGCSGSNTTTVTIIPGVGNLTGYVTYGNLYNTGLNGVTITLHNLASGTIAGVTTSGPNTLGANEPGFYTFSGVPDGSYKLTSSYNGTWGGNNATDALIVQLNVIGSYPLAGLPLAAADVNSSTTITGLDALYIKLRTIGSISSYPAGDWKVDEPTFAISGSPVTQNLTALCTGDVNGTFVPLGYKESAFLSVVEDSVITVPVGEPFVYDIRSGRDAELGAMTLFLKYDSDRYEVMEVTNRDDGMKYSFGDGKISIAWTDTKPLTVHAGDLLLSLNMRVKDKLAEPSRVFSIMAGSEFADILASPYDNFDLKMANVMTPDGSQEISMYNYPNPFAGTTTIVYTLPQAGHATLVLTDLYGKTIRTLADRQDKAGTHAVTVDPSVPGMAPGVYLYKIIFGNETDTWVKINKMVFTR
ncbi:MAG: T9SS type A sorting domain-containing protein, partial [bacterium]